MSPGRNTGAVKAVAAHNQRKHGKLRGTVLLDRDSERQSRVKCGYELSGALETQETDHARPEKPAPVR